MFFIMIFTVGLDSQVGMMGSDLNGQFEVCMMCPGPNGINDQVSV